MRRGIAMNPPDVEPGFTPTGIDSDFAGPAEWARLYRLRGIQVVPAWMPGEPPGDTPEKPKWKRPYLNEWVEYQEALVPDELFSQWYSPGGQYAGRSNMGAITGRASDNLLVIDLDDYKNLGAREWWRDLVENEGNRIEPETVEQRTGGGGRQKIFRAPPGWAIPNKNIHSMGIDIKGQGGFVMLPPSRHGSGNNYEWAEGQSPDDIPIAMAPDWLLEAVEKLVAQHGGVTGGNGKTHHEGPQGVYDPLSGKQIDGRESYMRDMVWRVILDWSEACPIKPSDAESARKAQQEYEVYEREVNPQKPHPADLTKTQKLDREDRGWNEWWSKWQRAMRKWDSDVYTEARKPGRERTKRDNNSYRDYSEEFQKERVDPNTGSPAPIQWLDMSGWDNIPVPSRKWAIRNRVPLNQVGLFSGEGGTGKSIIELMKDVAHVVGDTDWLGSIPEQGPAFYLGAEDEADEIHIRLDAIARHYKTTFRALIAGGLKVLPLLGQDSMLCVQSGRGNHIETTPLYRQLYEAAGDLKPKNISIDTLSRAFGGDEINRVQVYAFAMHMQALAKVAQGSVTILSHPSLSGMASGSGISGSTAWHGAFRFRQYLKGVKAEDDADPADDDLRELEFKKNQYGPRSRPVILRYVDGLFLPVNGATDPERVAREARADGCFVNLLRKYRERGDDVSHKSKSHYYAPRLFVEETAAREHKFRQSEMEDAMRRLMDGGRVMVELFKKGDRSQARLVLTPGS